VKTRRYLARAGKRTPVVQTVAQSLYRLNPSDSLLATVTATTGSDTKTTSKQMEAHHNQCSMVISNYTLYNDLQIPFITEEIKRYSTLYYNRLIGLENSYVTELRNPLNVRRRLKRQWPSDLKNQREEEE
jgi:hypothetical protein